jgi:hypothetical protein
LTLVDTCSAAGEEQRSKNKENIEGVEDEEEEEEVKKWSGGGSGEMIWHAARDVLVKSTFRETGGGTKRTNVLTLILGLRLGVRCRVKKTTRGGERTKEYCTKSRALCWEQRREDKRREEKRIMRWDETRELVLKRCWGSRRIKWAFVRIPAG